MARGSKEKYTAKQKRQAQHIEEGVMKRGGARKEAARVAWATVNKETGGAGKRVSNVEPSRKGAQKAAAARKRSEERTVH